MSATLFVAATITLWWALHAWRTPQTLRATRFAAPDGSHALTFSLLLPARHEEAVLARTVRHLLHSRHRDFELILIVGHDDPGTAAVAEELAAAHPQVSVVVDHHEVKSKPKALNTALPACTGDVVGVFDAEDVVHPDLLTHVDYAFRRTGATVVQGGVQLINFRSNWYSVRNCLEYFFWFRSRLHLQAHRGFIPLGGNTVFVRSEVLREVGGWDPHCLAEDCDLGVRLSSLGHRVVVAYDALLVTREETPDTALALFKQRTRWNQGFLQVLRKGDWRQLPTRRQRMLARYTLASPFVQAFTGVATLVGFTSAVLFDLPVGVALLTYLPLLPTVATLFFEVIGLHDFGRQYGLRIRVTDYLRLVVGTPVYMLLLAGAAVRAVLREWRGRREWELTRHVGAHLVPEPAAVPAVAGVDR
ncbi:glycosyltransferase [Pilimelia anulata]|uniref:glycosyltransferase n=1 Tax=Pilimelia anulata TaxID=53371 RepID=UPI001E36F3B3|nr:glycosyltransferase [Pilimelia anulata]